MQKTKRIVSLFITLCMLMAFVPNPIASVGSATALAAATGGISYVDENGQVQTYTGEYTLVENSKEPEWGDGWYVVKGNVDISKDTHNYAAFVPQNANANLILMDGCTLNANASIKVFPKGSLTIYGQSASNGILKVTPGENGLGAGIGSCDGITVNSGKITINGGNITLSGGKNGAGIGSSFFRLSGRDYIGTCGDITINGGTVTATGGTKSAGIGGGCDGNGGDITINGGKVGATGGEKGAGIGGGYMGDGGGTFKTTGSGNAIIKASSIADNDDKTGWSGIIFEGNDGGVYGNQTLSSAFEVESGKKLLITENATLNAGSNLTNNGTVYVDGTLNGTVGGNVYYPLTVTDCTANNTSTYSGKTYVKSGDTVTLTADSAPAGKVFDSWTVTDASDATLTVTNGTFTMPSKAVTVTANFEEALTISRQPANTTVTYGDTATLSVVAEKHTNAEGDLSYQWYQKTGETGTELNGEKGSTLSLSGLTVGDYTYYCVAQCGDYSITSDLATVTVKQAVGSVTITGDPGKTYDGQPAALTDSGYTVTGDGDVTVEYKVKDANDSTYTVTAPTNAGDYTVKVTKAAGTNYAEVSNTKDFTISRKTVTVSGITANDKTYDGNTDATLVCTNAVFDGKVDGDTLSVTATGTFGDKNAAVGKTVNITDMALGGASKDNYILAENGQQATTTATISPKAVTGVTLTSNSAVYTGSCQSPDISAVKADTLTLADTDYTVSYKNSSGEAVTDLTNVGSYTVVVTAKENSNFSGSAETGFQITKAGDNSWTTEPSITGWTYGESAKTPTYQAKYGNSTVKVEYRPASSTNDADYTTNVPTDVGSYTVRFTVTETDNYAGLTETKSLTIDKKAIGINWTDTELTYNGQAQKPAATATGLKDGDTCAIIVTGEQTNAGSGYIATATAVDNPNYTLPDNNTATFSIARKEVTVEAGSYKVSKVYDGNTTAGTSSGELSVSGILDADSGVCVVSTPGAYTSPDVGGQSTVAVSLALEGTGSDNYQLAASSVSVPCTITAKPITINTASATNRDYEANNTFVEADVTFTGAVNSLTKNTDYTVAGTMTDSDVGNDKTVNVTVTLLNGNYSLAVSNTTTTVNVGKIAYTGTTTANGSAIYGNHGRVDLSNYLADGYVIGTITKTNETIFEGDPSMDGTALTFSFANVPDNVGQTAVITIPVTGTTNYDPYSIAVTVTVEAKTVPTVTAPTAAVALIYSGEAQTLISAGSTTGGEMQYSVDGENWSSDIPTGTDAKNYTVYYKVVGDSNYNDVEPASITVTIAALAENTPNISIDYENETLTGFDANSRYTIGGTDVTINDGILAVESYIGKTISIVKKASDANHADSTAQTLTVPARPTAPTGISSTRESEVGAADGTIINVDSTMEYKAASADAWQSVAGTQITGLAAGDYQVRYKATQTQFASAAAEVNVGVVGKFTITFVNYDNEVLQSTDVENGSIPQYSGETPTKPSDDMYTYTFAGWEPKVTAVTENATYTAKFDSTLKVYNVTLNLNGGTVENADNYKTYSYGTGLILPIPTKENYYFGGWYDNEDLEGTAVTAVTAEDTGDKTYYAKWTEEEPTEYTITFVNYDNTTLQSGPVAVGTLPVYNGETPTRPDDSKYSYTFAGWSSEISEVSGIAVYAAQFERTPIAYNVEITDEGSAVVLAPEAVTDYVLIFAAYDDNGMMCGIELKYISFDAAGEQEFAPQTLDTSGAAKVKVMLWSGISEMSPKCGSDEVSL